MPVSTWKRLVRIVSPSPNYTVVSEAHILTSQVPPTMRFILDGEMPSYLQAKDLILQVSVICFTAFISFSSFRNLSQIIFYSSMRYIEPSDVF